MPTTSKPKAPIARLRFHPNAYLFVFQALKYTQDRLHRSSSLRSGEDAHITGQELVEGIREFGLQEFGLMARTVFRHWGIESTDDFGRLVFELIERGEMRKTERDQLSDFCGVYDFEEALDRNYQINTRHAFE